MFGDVTIAPIATTAPPATVAPNKFNSALQNINSVLTNVVKPAADVYTQVKPQGSGSSSSGPSYSPSVTSPGSTAAPAPASNTKKYLIIGGVGLAVIAGVYFIVKRKKGKKK